LRDEVGAIISMRSGRAYPILAAEYPNSERKNRIAAQGVRRWNAHTPKGDPR